MPTYSVHVKRSSKPVPGGQDKKPSSKNWLSKFVEQWVRSFQKIAGFKLDSGSQKLVNDAKDFEQFVVDAIHDVAKNAFGELQASTPTDTGVTAKEWSMNTVISPKRIVWELDHSNPLLIEWLNYGTKPHVIRPRTKKAMRFFVKGIEVFATEVHHPGFAGTGFVDRVLSKTRQRLELIDKLGGHGRS